MSGFKPSGRASAIGFERPRYIEHPRSRWHGSLFWLVADNPKAVPARVREKGEQVARSPKQIAKAVAGAQQSVDGDSGLRIRAWTSPRTQASAGYLPVQAPRLGGLLEESLIAIGVNAHFLAWIERHTPPGEWWLPPKAAPVYKTTKGRLMAVLMPVRIDDVFKLHGINRNGESA